MNPSCSQLCSPFSSIHHNYMSCILLTRPSLKPLRRTRSIGLCRASLITSPDSFEVGRLIGSYGFMNVTSYSGLQSGPDIEYSFGDVARLRMQDVGEGGVEIRLYEGRITQGPSRGTPIIFKTALRADRDLVIAICGNLAEQEQAEVAGLGSSRGVRPNIIYALVLVYPGQRAGGTEADMMAANELNAHAFLQSSPKGLCQNLVTLVGGFETKTGEQWLAFRNDGKYSAADYAKVASEKTSRAIMRGETSWNPFQQEEITKRRRKFVIKLLQGTITGLAFMHANERLHQSLGPSSVVLNTMAEKDTAYLVPRLRDLAFSVDIRFSYIVEGPGTLSVGLWRRASSSGAFTAMEKRAFGIADDIYEAGLLSAYLAFVPFCEPGVMDSLSLQRLLESTFRLDLEAVREYCLADERLVEAVKFLDLGDGAGWELLQAMLNPDFRKRPTAAAILDHRFMTATVLPS